MKHVITLSTIWAFALILVMQTQASFSQSLGSQSLGSADNNKSTQSGSSSLSKADRQELESKGAWLISKTNNSFEDISKTFNFLVSQKISPQALDRNIAGELLIISQLSPPAEYVSQWELGVYETEKAMMSAMEEKSKERWIPTSFDVQNDAAFVLYVKNEDFLTAARLIKVKSTDELKNSIQIYYDLGFLPTAITTYQDGLWIIFVKTSKNPSVENVDVLIRYAKKDDTDAVLTRELANKKVSLIDAAYTADDKVVFLFKELKKN